MSIQKRALQAVAPPGMPWAMPGTSHIRWRATNQPQPLWAERIPNRSQWRGRLGRLDESLSKPWQAPVRRCNETHIDPFTLMNIDDHGVGFALKRQILQSKSESSWNAIWFRQTPEWRNKWKALVLCVFVSLSKVCCNPILSVKPSIEIIRAVYSSGVGQKTSTVCLVGISWTEPKQDNKRPTEKNMKNHNNIS